MELFMKAGVTEAGCDEAGRGCLAGPVSCAAVVLPADFSLSEMPFLNDSKQLSERRREQMRPLIESRALAWAVVMVSPRRIDRLNILQASLTGMREALELVARQLGRLPGHVLIDGNKWNGWRDVPATTVVGGDGRYASIAAASILAKTHRDALMLRLAANHPGYGWERNKGYPTREHREGIARLGVTHHHRLSYGPCHPGLFDLAD